MLELIVEVSLLFLGADHVHDLAVLREAGGAVSVALRVALKAVLVEGVAAQEVHRGQLQGAVADAALGLLKDFWAVQRRPGQDASVRQGQSQVEKRQLELRTDPFSGVCTATHLK